MTPFMARVARLTGADVEGLDEPDDVPLAYRTRPSVAMPVNLGADRHVAVRSLSEQLVCEANAVLAQFEDHLALYDEAVPDELAFTVTYRGRAVRVSTRFEDHIAYGRLIGDGVEPGPARELEGPDAVADLLILLLTAAGLPQHTISS